MKIMSLRDNCRRPVFDVVATQSPRVRKIFRPYDHVARVQFAVGAASVMWAGKPRPYNIVVVKFAVATNHHPLGSQGRKIFRPYPDCLYRTICAIYYFHSIHHFMFHFLIVQFIFNFPFSIFH
jgi:hypothetical protein